jgi:bifunctional oligoribonuclease and PAP phosphatase NrnA
MTINDAISLLKKSRNIGITYHTSPDGDSLGSSLALMQCLRKLGKQAYILSRDTVPEVYSFLPFIDEVNNAAESPSKDIDCVVVLDCGNFERISANLNAGFKQYTLINIDHHMSNSLYGDLNFVDPSASAVGEIIYKILKSLDVELDKNISICLYTSILSDTGGFKHSNTTNNTHVIAGDLIKMGFDFSEVHRLLFQNKKFKSLKLHGKILENMYLIHKESICIMKLTKSMLEELNMQACDTSDIISLGIDIDTVEVAALIKEADDGVKISLRSKSVVDVRKIAELFGGGGHIRASGLSINKKIDEAEKLIINAIEKELV